MSGNRNFPEKESTTKQQPKKQVQNSFKRAAKKKSQVTTEVTSPDQSYVEARMEAQKNRMRNEKQEDAGIAKIARGGIAMVINSAAAEERSRSGS